MQWTVCLKNSRFDFWSLEIAPSKKARYEEKFHERLMQIEWVSDLLDEIFELFVTQARAFESRNSFYQSSILEWDDFLKYYSGII